MKLIQLLLFPLSIGALNLPRYRASDDGTQDVQTRITAFIVGEDGRPKVECWEVSSSTEAMEVHRKDGSVGTAYRSRLAKKDDLSVEILSWPPYSPIWPEPSSNGRYRATQLFSGQNFFSLFKGLIVIERISLFNVTEHTLDDDDGPYYFGPDNGDDWFYFEDTYTGSDLNTARAESPFTIDAKSGGNTQLLAIQHTVRPPYKKVHDGACGYTGVRVPAEGKSTTKHIELNVQFEEL